MKTIVITLSLFFLSFIAHAQANTIKVTISNFESNEGLVLAALYTNEHTFLNSRFKGEVSVIKNKMAEIIFTDVPDGMYAISAFHDEDKNGTLNMALGFYPTEDTATSNNAPARFGPPIWEDAKFDVRGGKTIHQQISM